MYKNEVFLFIISMDNFNNSFISHFFKEFFFLSKSENTDKKETKKMVELSHTLQIRYYPRRGEDLQRKRIKTRWQR
jgi:hypothetical protein